MTDLPNLFTTHLKIQGFKPISIRSYRSDLNHFLGWLTLSVRGRNLSFSQDQFDLIKYYFRESYVTAYKQYLIDNNLPSSTINRRLSTIRTLADFCLKQGLISSNPTLSLTNLETAKKLVIEPEQNEILDKFNSYLKAQNNSTNTIKNYLSDIREYVIYAQGQLNEKNMARDFLQYIAVKGASKASLKRLESSLKKFYAWALEEKLLSINPFLRKFSILNFNFSFRHYRALPYFTYLNFLILIIFLAALGFGVYRQFIVQAPQNLAFPNAPVTPKRYLSFQGLLTNADETPITVATNVTFKLYDAAGSGTPPTGGNLLWNSGTCSIDPDTSGIFDTILGSTCGTEIPSSVFTENNQVWMEITVISDTLSPRIQIATVAYALNAETLQGFPIASTTNADPTATMGATARTITAINPAGNLVLASTSPTLWSTSGTFAIKGQALSVVSEANGNITLAPNGSGLLNLTLSANTGNVINASDANLGTSGGKEANTLYYGSVANNNTNVNLLKLESGSSPTPKFTIDYAGNASMAGALNVLSTITANTTDTINGLSISSASLTDAVNITMTGYVDMATAQWIGLSNSEGRLVFTDATPDEIDVQNANLDLNNNLILNIGDAGTDFTTGGGLTLTGYATSSSSLAVGYSSVLAGVGNAVFAGSVGIGSTSPSSLLDVAGTAHLRGASGITGLFVNSSGYVGAGTTSPTQKLDVVGNATISGTLALGPNAAAYAGTCDASARGKQYYNGVNDTMYYCNGSTWITMGTSSSLTGSGTANYIPKWNTSSDLTNSILYDTGTNIGIGTSVPLAKLDVAGTASFSGDLFFAENTKLGPKNAGLLSLAYKSGVNSWTEALTVGITGNIGIGTTAPSKKLDVNGDINLALSMAYYINGGSVLNATTLGSTVVNSSLDSVDALNAGSITNGFGSIDTGADNIITTGTMGSAGNTAFTGLSLILSGQFSSSYANSAAINLTGNGAGITFTGTGANQIVTAASQNLALMPGGNVGIGTTSPAAKLEVAGTSWLRGDTGTTGLFVNSSGNVGIGTTAPAALLDVAGNATVSGYLGFGNNAPAFTTCSSAADEGKQYYNGVNDTMYYCNGTSWIAMGTSSTLTGSGTANYIPKWNTSSDLTNSILYDTGTNIGIGTSVPLAKLDVSGTASVSSNLYLGSSIRPSNSPLSFDYKSGADTWATAMTIANTGYIGIGTTAPSVKLEVNGGGLFSGLLEAQARLNVSDNSASTLLYGNQLGAGWLLQLQQNSVNKLYVDNSGNTTLAGNIVVSGTGNSSIAGNVGIGTTAPGYKFDVLGGFSRIGAWNTSTVPASDANGGLIVGWNRSNGSAEVNLYNAYSNPTVAFQFSKKTGASTYTDLVTIKGDGNVGIGTTNPGAKLNVVGATGINDPLARFGTTGATDSHSIYLENGSGTFSFFVSGAVNTFVPGTVAGDGGARVSVGKNMFFGDGNAARMVLLSNGNIGIGTTSPTTTLDINTGNLRVGGLTASSAVYTDGSKILTTTAPTTGTLGFWQRANGSLAPTNITDDILIGATATTSAKFAFINNWGSTAVASISGNLTLASTPGTVRTISSTNNTPLSINPNGGNVGIGTTAPGAKLQVSSSETGYASTLAESVSKATTLFRTHATDSTVTSFGGISGGDGYIQRSNGIGTTSYNLLLDPFGGNVGIGTTGPSSLLHINATAGAIETLSRTAGAASGNLGTIYFGNTDVDSTMVRIQGEQAGNSNYGRLTFYTKNAGGSGERLRIDEAGNVGIGTTAPSGLLDVTGSAGSVEIATSGDILDFTKNSYNYIRGTGGSSSHLSFESGGIMQFMAGGTGGTADMYINSAGNVGIGTTSPNTPLEVVGTARARIFADQETPEYYLDPGAITTSLTLAGRVSIGIGFTSPIGALHISKDLGGNAALIVNQLGTGDIFSASASGSPKFVIANSGNVGIGTTGPGFRLDVQDDDTPGQMARFLNTASYGRIIIEGADGTGGDVMFKENGISQWGIYSSGQSAAATLGFYPADGITPAMLIQQGGNVGIGTTNPGSKLDVIGTNSIHVSGTAVDSGGYVDTSGSSALYLAGGAKYSSGSYTYTAKTTVASSIIMENGLLLFNTNSGLTAGNTFSASERMRIDTSGNVGIGTTNPSYKLEVSAGDIYTSQILRANTGWFTGTTGPVTGTGTKVALGSITSYNINTGEPLDFTTWGQNLYFNTGLTGGVVTNMTINSSGNVGIGTTNPLANLDVTGTASVSSYLYLNGNLRATNNPLSFNYKNGANSWLPGITIGNNGLVTIANGNLATGNIYPITTASYTLGFSYARYNNIYGVNGDFSGNVGIGTTAPGTHRLSVVGTAGLSTGTAWTNTSDIRFKTIENNLNGTSLEKILSLNPISFRWNDLHNQKFGTNGKNLNYGFVAQEVESILPSMVTTDSEGYKWYNPSGFEAILTAAIQEQQLQIASLSGQLVALNNQPLNTTGDLNIVRQSDGQTVSAPAGQNFSLSDSAGQLIQRIGAFSEAAIANLRTGLIQSTQIITDTLSSTQINTDKLLSPVIETNEIGFKNNDLGFKNKDGKTVMKINENGQTMHFGDLLVKGNIYTEGSLTARSATVSGELTVSNLSDLGDLRVSGDATIGGTLYADEIVTKHGTFGDLLAKQITTSTVSAQYITNIYQVTEDGKQKTENRFQNTENGSQSANLSSAISPQDPSSAFSLQSSSPSDTLASPISSDSALLLSQASSWVTSDPNGNLKINSDVQILGRTSLADTSIAGQLMVDASLLINSSGISSLPTSTLYLQPSGWGSIDLMAGKVLVDLEGNIQTLGKIMASEFAPLPNSDLTFNLERPLAATDTAHLYQPSSSFGKLLVKGLNNETVASIDENGNVYTEGSLAARSAKFQKLTIASDYTATQSAIISEINTNATSGIGLMPAGYTEFTIYNTKITNDTLIYVTPEGSTQNKVLYISAKQTENPQNSQKGFFKVAIDTAINTDIKFNWWIIN